MHILRIVDAKGTAIRLLQQAHHSNGPNETWHSTRYDQLKPSRLKIPCCVD